MDKKAIITAAIMGCLIFCHSSVDLDGRGEIDTGALKSLVGEWKGTQDAIDATTKDINSIRETQNKRTKFKAIIATQMAE
ncbi:MAG: hypothetical protein LBJ75_03360 [Puniceicoccales bacterium]|nr:hypothetical protein [Puniceicoccales bacterium]